MNSPFNLFIQWWHKRAGKNRHEKVNTVKGVKCFKIVSRTKWPVLEDVTVSWCEMAHHHCHDLNIHKNWLCLYPERRTNTRFILVNKRD